MVFNFLPSAQANEIKNDHQLVVGNYIAVYTEDLKDSLVVKDPAK